MYMRPAEIQVNTPKPVRTTVVSPADQVPEVTLKFRDSLWPCRVMVVLEGWVANDIDLLKVLLLLVAASPTVALGRARSSKLRRRLQYARLASFSQSLELIIRLKAQKVQTKKVEGWKRCAVLTVLLWSLWPGS